MLVTDTTCKDNEAPERIYYYANDPNGCPSRLLNETGKVVWAALYDAWGKVKKLPNIEVNQPLRLQGQYFDAETGLHYNRFRYYCPEIGAFVSQDPLGLVPGENVYAFGPNAQKWIDPLGLKCDPYAGVKEASQYLKSQGVPRQYRKQILESFDVRTIKMDTARPNTYGLRFHDYGVNAQAKGRYLFESFNPLTNRNNLALPHDWNKMTGIKQWQVKPGTPMIKGAAAPQFQYGSQYVGGETQWYINSMDNLLEP